MSDANSAIFQLYHVENRLIFNDKCEDNKVVIRRFKCNKDKQRNGQKKEDTGTNNDLKNITHKIKDRSTQTPLKTAGTLCSI